MRAIPVDLETTIIHKGHPFDPNNYVCYVGVADKAWDLIDGEPVGPKLKEIQEEIDKADVLSFVNAKFDLHHLRNLGIKFEHKRIWDCSLVDFMLEGQTTPYPSMNKMAEKYELPLKPDIKEVYWANGICTSQIPKEEIISYLKEHDLPTTDKIYHIQKEKVSQRGAVFERLVSLSNQDLLVLAEMEYNGFYFDEAACLEMAEIKSKEIDVLRMEMYDYHNIPEFNTESGDHLSCLIYGGTITISRKEVVGIFKTGDRKGEDKSGWVDYSFTLPRQFTPLPKTELKKEGYYATGEDVLKQLKCKDKAGKRLLDVILSLAKLEKIVGTYYKGLPKLREEMNWTKNILHGNLNQVTARTGRLSSTKPNLQNIAGELKTIFNTRFNYE